MVTQREKLPMDTTPNRLAELMRARAMNATELAARCGRTSVSITDYIEGRRTPPLAVAELIAEALGVASVYDVWPRRKRTTEGLLPK